MFMCPNEKRIHELWERNDFSACVDMQNKLIAEIYPRVSATI